MPKKATKKPVQRCPSGDETLTVSAIVNPHGDRDSSADELEELVARRVSTVSTANAGAHDVWIPHFLAALERSPNWSLAARVAGVSRSAPHKRAEVDPDFASAAAAAEQNALDLIEAAAFKSAVYGDLEPVFHEGVKVGEVVRYSHQAREMLLKAGRPGKYRERVREAPLAQVNIGIQITPEKAREIQERNRRNMELLIGRARATVSHGLAPAPEAT